MGKIDILRTRFLARAAGNAREIDTVLVDLGAKGPQAVAAIERIAHRLAGSGSSFGFPGISARAEAVEQIARALISGRTTDLGPFRRASAALRDELAHSAARGTDFPPALGGRSE